MHDYEFRVLSALKDRKSLSMEQLAAFTKLRNEPIVWALENLLKAGAIRIEKESTVQASLSEEGRSYLEAFPEEKVVESIGKAKGKVKIYDIKDAIGLNWAKKNGWIVIVGGFAQLTAAGEAAVKSGSYEMREVLQELSRGPEAAAKAFSSKRAVVEALAKRGLVEIKERSMISSVSIAQKGAEMISTQKADTGIGEISKEIIASGSWKDTGFRPYNIDAQVDAADVGRTHPLRDLIDRLKDTYVSLGFTEVSGPIIGPAFWAFDALFVQQDHPARTMMDTFYLSNPKSIEIDAAEMQRVKREHEKAYHEKWSEDIAKQAILRPHTTAISSMQIFNIVKGLREHPEEYELPIKLFTIGRNFRNENVDYKHLADFYQMDGLIIGEKLTLSNLFDTLLKIYSTVGIKVRFLPSYFPFVEPGVEIQSFRDGEWMEMGGAGMIRREIVGISRKKLGVLAWGPGIERILLFKDKDLESITQLYNNGIGWVRRKQL